jgi:hypothetical protein
MKKFRRKFNLNLIKKNYSYTIQEISEILCVHVGTVRSWIKDGLKTIDSTKPFLIYCEDLRSFLSIKQNKRKHKCSFNEFYCLKCRNTVLAATGTVSITTRNEKIANLSGICSICSSRINKTISVQKIPEAIKAFNILTLQNKHILELTSPSLITNLETI